VGEKRKTLGVVCKAGGKGVKKILKFKRGDKMYLNRFTRNFTYFLTVVCFLIFIGCNKKYYQSVANAKEDANSMFVILKSGEKIEIKGAKMLGNGTIQSIGVGGKDFQKDDIKVIQNKTAYYKRFYFDADKKVREKDGFIYNASFSGNRFAERYKKGAINTYIFIGTSNYTASSGASSTFVIFTVFELEATKEFVVYRWNSDYTVTNKIESWIDKSAVAIKIINDYKGLSRKAKEKYHKDVYEEAVDKYNEDFASGLLSK
jgi:hypothetical protein